MTGRAKAADKQRGHFISCRFDSINRHQYSIRCWDIVSGIRSLACARATAYDVAAMRFVFNMGHGICSLLGAATSKRTTASATTTRGDLGWGEDRGREERGKRKGDERGKTREEKTGEKRKEKKREERRDRRRDEREKRKED